VKLPLNNRLNTFNQKPPERKTNMTLPLSADEKSALSKLMHILKPLRDFADGLELTLTLPLIDTLLLAASHPDKGVEDFARMAGVRPGTMTRWLQDLSDIGRIGKPGLGLVVRSQLYDRRSVASKLTPKGRAIVGQIAAAMQPAVKVAA
jgi:DNA-binding MarR family transcriptional regulator